MAINQSVNKALKQVDFKIHRSGNGSGSGGGSSIKTCHKCVKRGHIKKDFRSKGNGSSGNPPNKSANELSGWVNRKPVVSYTKDLATATISIMNNKYKLCTS